jgi:hypothetical protein
MSLSQFLELYGTEEQWEAALAQARWPNRFHCPRCGEQEYGRRHRCNQYRSCRHQVRLAPDELAKLRTAAAARDWTMAQLLRDMIRQLPDEKPS